MATEGKPGLHMHILGNGPRSILALHCALSRGKVWSALAQQLPELRVLAPDLPGHGLSADWSGKGDYCQETARALVPMLEQAASDAPLDLIGHSFGAVMALRLALERPELVRSLVLIEPVLFAAARSAGAPEYARWLARAAPYRASLAAGDTVHAAALFQEEWGTGPLTSAPVTCCR